MKSKILFSLCPALLALLVVAGARNVEAADIQFSDGHRDYRTVDPNYNAWYPEGGTSYGYSNNLVNAYTYTAPDVYTTPSVEFGAWYGEGNRSRGRGGYSGGFRRGRGNNGR